jgi:hypothetical protein
MTMLPGVGVDIAAVAGVGVLVGVGVGVGGDAQPETARAMLTSPMTSVVSIRPRVGKTGERRDGIVDMGKLQRKQGGRNSNDTERRETRSAFLASDVSRLMATAPKPAEFRQGYFGISRRAS